MKQKNLTLIVLSIILTLIIVPIVFSAKIHGTVYDMGFNKVNGVIIEADSTPKQRFISVNGSYVLNMPNGNYTITATYNDGVNIQETEEKIYVIDNDEYTLDLFLFIDITQEQNLVNVSEINPELDYNNQTLDYTKILIISIIILLLLIGVFVFKKISKNNQKNNNETNKIESKELKQKDNNLEKIISLIKKNDGRITQKEIRKEIPLSEAKISLMITQLENEGKIKRIKKGRGNIIVLQ